jgi:hypothetical protein
MKFGIVPGKKNPAVMPVILRSDARDRFAPEGVSWMEAGGAERGEADVFRFFSAGIRKFRDHREC